MEGAIEGRPEGIETVNGVGGTVKHGVKEPSLVGYTDQLLSERSALDSHSCLAIVITHKGQHPPLVWK